MDLALDLIKEVGPRGHYLRQKHTRQHIRDFRLPSLYGKIGVDGESLLPREAALEEFMRIYKTHAPEPLPKEVTKELDSILAAADREAERLT
jgi:trimethylamine--corrinoid protein Co-methyltransferase